MDFDSDPAADFLSREREELGELENEIINGNFFKTSLLFHLLASVFLNF